MDVASVESQLDDAIVCSVCMETIEDDKCILPGCGHKFHCVCMLNFAQYDTKCPTCRQQPIGVIVRKHAEHESGIAQLDVIRDRLTEARRVWTRYVKKRSACIRKHPEMRELNTNIRMLKREIDAQTQTTQQCFNKKCNTLWKVDDELQVHKRVLTALERKHRRLKKKLKDSLHSHIGPEPDPRSPIFMLPE